MFSSTPRKPSHFGSYCHSPVGSSSTSSASIGGKGRFFGGTAGRTLAVPELDGEWNVERRGGLLPPLVGVRKRIHGNRGETTYGRLPGMPFDIVGLSLRYRAP